MIGSRSSSALLVVQTLANIVKTIWGAVETTTAMALQKEPASQLVATNEWVPTDRSEGGLHDMPTTCYQVLLWRDHEFQRVTSKAKASAPDTNNSRLVLLYKICAHAFWSQA